MNISQLSKWLYFCGGLFLGFSHGVFADTIYQWTDQWGQIKYSKMQVPGSMVSELTELPELQVVTEQQKQEAMLNKIQEMKNTNTRYKQKKTTEKFLKQQKIIKDKHCRVLRNMLADVKLRNSKRYYPGHYYFSEQYFYSGRNYFPNRYGYYPGYSYDFLENDIYREIREYCR